jgi:predicted nucleic acid-binding protein
MYSNLPLRPRSKGILLDTNLLTALIVGYLGNGEVERFKRTRQFSTEDVVELNKIVEKFGWRCTTPHVLAEVSNLLDWLDDDKKSKAGRLLAAYVRNAKEVHVSAAEIVKTPVYYKLGLTDAGLVMLARQEDCAVFTADLPLYHYASNLKIEIFNFNHLKDQWL